MAKTQTFDVIAGKKEHSRYKRCEEEQKTAIFVILSAIDYAYISTLLNIWASLRGRTTKQSLSELFITHRDSACINEPPRNDGLMSFSAVSYLLKLDDHEACRAHGKEEIWLMFCARFGKRVRTSCLAVSTAGGHPKPSGQGDIHVLLEQMDQT